MLVVVCYDIPDDDRRLRLARILEGYGERVQRSVFECFLDGVLWSRLRDEAKEVLDPLEDRFRCYALCAKDERAVRRFGVGPPATEPAFLVIE